MNSPVQLGSEILQRLPNIDTFPSMEAHGGSAASALPKEKRPAEMPRSAQRRVRVASVICAEAGKFPLRKARAPALRVRDAGCLTESLHLDSATSWGRRGSLNGGARRKRHLAPRALRRPVRMETPPLKDGCGWSSQSERGPLRALPLLEHRAWGGPQR